LREILFFGDDRFYSCDLLRAAASDRSGLQPATQWTVIGRGCCAYRNDWVSSGLTCLQALHQESSRSENMLLQQRAGTFGIACDAKIQNLPVLPLRLIEVMRLLPGETQ